MHQKLVFLLFKTIWNERKTQRCKEVFAPNVVLYSGDTVTKGAKTLQNYIEHWLSAFPDIHHTVDQVITSKDLVVVRWKGKGTHRGVFNGLLPTKQKMHYSGITIFQIKNKKFSKIWLTINSDQLYSNLEIYSEKVYKESDFYDDFHGPAKKIYQWMMKARAVPSCKQKIANALRDQFAYAPLDGPDLIVPKALFRDISVAEKRIGKVRTLIYRPKKHKNKPLPILLYMHGGGWTVGKPEDTDLITRKLAWKADCEVISIDYRLAPEHPYPAGLQDCLEVYHWARKASKKKIAIGGDSCGGNLVYAMALTLRDQGQKQPDGILSICPVTDFIVEKYPAFLKIGPNSLCYDYGFINFVRSIYSRHDQWEDPYVSPMYANLSKICPSFVLSAGEDPLIDENIAFVQKLNREGCKVEHFIQPKMPHAYYYFLGLSKEEEVAYQKMASFLRAIFQSK